ncbi:MAG TPA: hypothetical protein VM261_17670 [Kofleriaceae bacterium]|nr:hypothetical protein [Kofleriaceae bacterium]
MKRIGLLLCAGALVVSAACEKDSGLSSKTSGSIRKEESALLAHLPSGNVGLFGGNYLRIQDFFQNSAFSKLMGDMEKMSPGMKEWTTCFVQTGSKKLQMLGAFSYADDGITMRYVMKGFGVEDVKTCAQKAGYPVDVDADGKYVSIGMATAMGPMRTGYLVLDDGALLTRAAMPMPPTGMMPSPATRADLEADVALAARGSAADDRSLVAELARIDRDRAVWFVADATNTPIGDKLGALRGWVDINKGLAMDVSFQLKDSAMADEIARGIPEMKKQADMLGKDVGNVIRSIKFERNGDRLRFGVSITEQQLERLMTQMAPFMGGGLGGGGGDFGGF